MHIPFVLSQLLKAKFAMLSLIDQGNSNVLAYFSSIPVLKVSKTKSVANLSSCALESLIFDKWNNRGSPLLGTMHSLKHSKLYQCPYHTWNRPTLCCIQTGKEEHMFGISKGS